MRKRTYDEDQMKEIVRIATSERAKLPVDSFSTFTNGLKANWIFIMFIGSTALWLVTNVFNLQAKNNSQDEVLKLLATTQKEMESNAKEYREKTDATFKEISTSNNEFRLQLNTLQEGVNYLKANKK